MSVTPTEVVIYTDGACKGNPGRGGWGAWLKFGEQEKELWGGEALTTNNRMELMAAIAGLELLRQPCGVILYSDSQYLVDAMMKGWAVKWRKNDWWRTNKDRAVNIDLWERLLPLCERHQVEFRWVKGHAGNVENERCDQLAMAALRQLGLPADEGYENKPETDGVRPAIQEGQPCRKCATTVIRQPGRRKPGRDTWFEYYLYCPQCKTTYPVEEARRFAQQTPQLL